MRSEDSRDIIQTFDDRIFPLISADSDLPRMSTATGGSPSCFRAGSHTWEGAATRSMVLSGSPIWTERSVRRWEINAT